MKRDLLLAAAILAIATSCAGGDKVLQTTIYDEGLRFCEGTVPYGSTILVSNFGTEEFNSLNSEGKGYIAQIDGQGVETLIAADGNLSAPKGMATKDDYLYIADVSKVVIYNLKERGGAPVVINMPEGDIFVNDIAISGDNAYISVTNSGKIFKLDISSPAQISAEDLTHYADVVGANGIVIDEGTMYIVSYPVDRQMKPENIIYMIEDIDEPVVTKFLERPGLYDGVAKSGNKLYFTSWADCEFGYIDMESKEVTIEKFDQSVVITGPADISLLDGAIYLPDLLNSRVVKIEL